MGLLDDAIREHLELKRLRGADPGVVAREENEALGPVPRGDRNAEGEHQGDQSEEQSASKGSFFADGEPAADFSSVGQETAEIDMHTVLDSTRDSEHPSESSHEEDERPVPADSRSSTEESLEWEVPGERNNESTDHPGSDDEHPDGADHIEDVLEETPDFLRDTPEQERLWFEQRPPRDFDFNE